MKSPQVFDRIFNLFIGTLVVFLVVTALFQVSKNAVFDNSVSISEHNYATLVMPQLTPLSFELGIAHPYIDINTATAPELTKKGYISEKLATGIVSYRKKYGTLMHIDELLAINGIGNKTMENLNGVYYISK